MFQIMFTEREAIRDYREFCAHVDREKFRRFAHALFAHGVYLSPSAALHSVTSAA
ncbi:MAG: aspartate aminotransferase family protein, partial [Gemmatimonadetes bacterium]|nr:aspartate aminotransferase family protein [Gemmatimonadota bacterium]NIS00271.1 aspartate aminotransferase family protein [Gemmatimonadota bacterium]NIT65883.1 aspartate aminotransferase family protein [Gemmatimonadota bacterium]NIU52826.1 aspartate aminotransferase family protein [Gemmatimonadota bacterium]NIV22510.1 aspartate aminotransferase family protein [Gemmatimonadota bacterium]